MREAFFCSKSFDNQRYAENVNKVLDLCEKTLFSNCECNIQKHLNYLNLVFLGLHLRLTQVAVNDLFSSRMCFLP